MHTPVPLTQASSEPDWLAKILERHNRTGPFATRLTKEACAPDAPCRHRIAQFIQERAQAFLGSPSEPGRYRGVAAFFTILDHFGESSMVQHELHFICQASCPGIKPWGIGRRMAMTLAAKEIVRVQDGNHLVLDADSDGIWVKFEGVPRAHKHLTTASLRCDDLRFKAAEFCYLAARVQSGLEDQLWKPGISIEGDQVMWAHLYSALST